jgi:long-chain acyl-CoA synthetase
MDAPWYAHYEPGVPKILDWPAEQNLPYLLDRAAKQWPDKVAIRYYVDPKLPSSTLTYRQLQEQSRRFATALFQLGVRKGDRVAIMLPNCPQFVIAFYGVLRIGAIAVNTNPLYVAREMREQFEDSGCETVILLSQFFPKLREIHAATRIRRVIVTDVAETLPWYARMLVHAVQRKQGEYVRVRKEADIFYFERLLERYPPTPPGAGLQPQDIALFQYTGGTTGVAKAAVLTHRNLVANTLQVTAWYTKVDPGNEVMMGALPFFHVYGMTACLLFAVWIGAETVIVPRPRPVDGVMKLLERHKVTVFPGVPTLYQAVNTHPDVKKFNLRSIKMCLSGAAPLPVEVQETFERLTGARLVEAYGLSETSPGTHVNPIFGRRKVGSIGLPLPETEAMVVDLDTREPVPDGQEGELAIRGPQVMLGYWNRPEENERALRDGWFFTGDVARRDEEGYFYIVDRKKDMIIASGLKVLPREVEEVLYLHPKVAEAVVAGVPDPYRGETVKAYVVLKPGEESTQEEILEFCKLHLATFKVPKQLEFRAELPKTAVGKYLRRVLVEEEKAKQSGEGA